MNRGSAFRMISSFRAAVGFNEAPIHESGKFERGPGLRPRRGHASMRPRFMNRGSLKDQYMRNATWFILQ